MDHKAAAGTNINRPFGPGTANKRTVWWWLKKFCEVYENLEMRISVAILQKLTMTSWEDHQS